MGRWAVAAAAADDDHHHHDVDGRAHAFSWEFAGDGQCVAIPYADKVPSFAKTNSWPVREVNQVVYVWHDVDGREPLW